VTFIHTPLLKGDEKKRGLFLMVLNVLIKATAFGFLFVVLLLLFMS
jgi:hypothetical protein